MSDAADEFEFLGRQLLKKSRTAALREHMQSFLDRHERPTDLKTLCRRTAIDRSLAETVHRNRDERL